MLSHLAQHLSFVMMITMKIHLKMAKVQLVNGQQELLEFMVILSVFLFAPIQQHLKNLLSPPQVLKRRLVKQLLV